MLCSSHWPLKSRQSYKNISASQVKSYQPMCDSAGIHDARKVNYNKSFNQIKTDIIWFVCCLLYIYLYTVILIYIMKTFHSPSASMSLPNIDRCSFQNVSLIISTCSVTVLIRVCLTRFCPCSPASPPDLDGMTISSSTYKNLLVEFTEI